MLPLLLLAALALVNKSCRARGTRPMVAEEDADAAVVSSLLLLLLPLLLPLLLLPPFTVYVLPALVIP